MNKPLFHKVDQVAVVVEDALATVRYLMEEFGVGPWVHIQFGDAHDGNPRWASIEDCVTEGEAIGTYCIECCCCSMPNGVELEVISPVNGSSIFARYLDRHGPGVQHVSIVQDDFDETIARMKAAGFSRGQLATVAKDETCAFIEHLSVLGTYLELHRRPAVFNPPPVDMVEFLPGPTPDVLPAKPRVFPQIESINIVTADLDGSLNVMRGQYGFEEWELDETEAARTAVYRKLNVDIRLSQPKDPDSAGGRLIQAHGTDIASLTVKIEGDPAAYGAAERDGETYIDLKQIFGAELKVER